jgi:ABC-2 type transport system permease protein
LPLTFISSVFVPTQGMPGWLQPIADWNPMSGLASACRHLFANPDPAVAVHA